MSTTSELFTKTRIRLLAKAPWYGQLAMQLNLVESRKIDTVNTDGTDLEVNPEFFEKLPQVEREAVMAVKVFQCAMRHPYRIGGRNLEQWNKASRDVAHANVAASKFKLPDNCEVDKIYADMSVEQAYAYNEKEAQKSQNKQKSNPGEGDSGDGKGKPQPATGTVSPAKKPASKEEEDKGDQPSDGTDQKPTRSEEDWTIAAEQASWLAAKAGKGSAALEMAVAGNRVATISWRDETREFITNTVASDMSYAKPNRRFLSQEMILPGPKKENIAELVVVFDTSGSVYKDRNTVEDFSAEVVSIAHDVRPEKLTVIYCDTKVTHVDSYDSYDLDTLKVRPLGAGGTKFQPAFDYIDDMDTKPAAIIYLTDLEGPAPTDSGIPTLWVTPLWVKRTGWFGETLRIDRHR